MPTVYPEKIMIETISGICNYRCIMCPVEDAPTVEIMPFDRFKAVLQKFVPYLEHQKCLQFCGLGELTLDKNLPEKVALAKAMGFRDTTVYTNGELLHRMSEELLSSGLDILVASIDGVTQEIQGRIRVRSKLDQVVRSVEEFIYLRNQMGGPTKVIIRFNRQDINRHEENRFHELWKTKLNAKYGDVVYTTDIHNVGGSVADSLITIKKAEPDGPPTRCPEVYGRMMVGSDGEMIFCCGDQTADRRHRLGNVLETDPVELYNHPVYQEYREKMEQGRIMELDLCKNCGVAHSIMTREIHTV